MDDRGDNEMAAVWNLSRRAFTRLGLAIAGLGLLSGVAAADANLPDSADVDSPEPPRPARLAKRSAFLQVVAHPDDDLYFLNPDVSDAVRTGTEVTTIVLTAAEAGGVNGETTHVDVPGYIAARQHGLRSAYAAMAGQPAEAAWHKERIPTRGGTAELHTLVAQPRVRIVFLNIEMGVYTGVTGDNNHTALYALWAGTQQSRPTLPPSGAVMSHTTSYTRDQLIGTLADLLVRFQPTTVRTLDPDPERRGPEAGALVWYTDAGLATDNQDHTATARFAWAAVGRFLETPQGSATLVDAYVGYGNARWKHNLGKGVLAEKSSYLSLYGWADGRPCDEASGCGDRNVGAASATTGWLQSTNLRHPGTSDWLVLGHDGLLSAYAVVGGRVRRWTETDPGTGRFGPPVDLGGGGLARHLSVAQDQFGRAHLAALRVNADAPPSGPFHEVMVSADLGDGLHDRWLSLGAPAGPVTGLTSGIGNPVLAVDGDGVHHLFVRTGDKTVAWASRDPSDARGWSDWTDLGGVHVRDTLSVVVDRAGDLELYADGNAMWRWRITGAGVSRTAPKAEQLPVAPSGDALTMTPLSGDRLLMTTRVPETGEVANRVRESPEARWRLPERKVGGGDGFGIVAAHPHGDGVFLAQRGGHGLVEVIWQPDVEDDATSRRWLSGPALAHRPALASDVAGNTVVAVVGPDGELYTARVETDNDDPALHWVRG